MGRLLVLVTDTSTSAPMNPFWYVAGTRRFPTRTRRPENLPYRTQRLAFDQSTLLSKPTAVNAEEAVVGTCSTRYTLPFARPIRRAYSGRLALTARSGPGCLERAARSCRTDLFPPKLTRTARSSRPSGHRAWPTALHENGLEVVALV